MLTYLFVYKDLWFKRVAGGRTEVVDAETIRVKLRDLEVVIEQKLA